MRETMESEPVLEFIISMGEIGDGISSSLMSGGELVVGEDGSMGEKCTSGQRSAE